jgi:hypothetical protein
MLGAVIEAWLNVGDGGKKSRFIANAGSGGTPVFALLLPATGRGDREIERFPSARGFDSTFDTNGSVVEVDLRGTCDTLGFGPRTVSPQSFMSPMADISKLRSFNVRPSESGTEGRGLVSCRLSVVGSGRGGVDRALFE